MIDVRQLAGALDLWLCMWEPEEQDRFETAVVRAMTDANPRPTRLHALALCHIVATPRLKAAASRVGRSGLIDAVESSALQIAAEPLRALIDAGRSVRGDLKALEQTLARFVSGGDARASDAALDWVDVRDLVAVARTTVDARLFAEVERRVARRGKYQRARAHHVLGFAVRPSLIEEGAVIAAAANAVTAAAAHSLPSAAAAARAASEAAQAGATAAARTGPSPQPIPASPRVVPAPGRSSDTSDVIRLVAEVLAVAASA